MRNVDGVSINAYLSVPDEYPFLLEYLSHQFGKPIVLGEFGKPIHLSTQSAQTMFNVETWHLLKESMRAGNLAGGFVFAYKHKPDGRAAEGSPAGLLQKCDVGLVAFLKYHNDLQVRALNLHNLLPKQNRLNRKLLLKRSR